MLNSSRFYFLIFFYFLFSLVSILWAQTSPTEGIHVNNPNITAFINARIVISPAKTIDNGTIVIRDSKIESVGENITPPADAKIYDVKGMTIYPGFIDSYSIAGAPRTVTAQTTNITDYIRIDRAQTVKTKGPYYWNDKVLARQTAEEIYNPDEKVLEKLRSQGFTNALIVPSRGFFRGSSAVINLSNPGAAFKILRKNVFQNLSFTTEPGTYEQNYPNSAMGTIALIRQVLYDADWYQKANEVYEKDHSLEKPELNLDLEALSTAIKNKNQFMIEINNEQYFFRAAKILKEFSLRGIICGSGYEYRRIDAIKKHNLPLVLPLNFPDPPAVTSTEDALSVSLQELKHWETAPFNPKLVSEAGIPFALTTYSLKDQSLFLPQLRKAVKHGLSSVEALAALTTTPAKFFGLEKELGTIEKGKHANLIVTDGDIFNDRTKIHETWINGIRYEVKARPIFDPRGNYSININIDNKTDSMNIILKGEPDNPEGSFSRNKKDTKLNVVSSNALQLFMSFNGDSVGLPGLIRMTGNYTKGEIIGIGETSEGKQFFWSGKLTTPFAAQPEIEKKKSEKDTVPEILYPAVAFGRKSDPVQPENLLLKNATIWTCGPQGIILNSDILIKKGKIAQVAQNINAPKDAQIFDASGKHITPGIIDCHSHTGIAGNANESGKTLTSETRIADVIDYEDISIYRQLAGGTTMSMTLHGSANPIGGQTAILKYRWGSLGDDMLLDNFTPGLKFALGENVKQSNYSDRMNPNPRYPQTRMGVEQIMADEFQAALDYKKSIELYEKTKKGLPVRRNLELDPIVEVLEGKRQAHVHAYRQDEILMMIRVAEKYNFKVASFIHVLEGYKVADVMAKHGAAGSTFSDWWGYKIEVWDAIPFNGALMDATGVSVSFNSDSDELARRLNLETAKAVKYGGVSPENAFKFVTINTAKQLRIDNKVGSLEAGKDADFVVWSGDPLSIYTLCEQSWVDGKKYFDRVEDQKMRDDIQKERARIIQKILSLKKEEKPSSRSFPERRPTNESGSTNLFEENAQ